jgi:o-succinylbenzoate synthase
MPKLAGYALYGYALPLNEPLAFGGVSLERREGLLLKLTGEDGAVGWGEASPLPGFSRESLREAAGELDTLAASLVGSETSVEPDGPRGAVPWLEDGWSPSARFGLELAVWSLCAATRGASLAQLISPRPRRMVAVSGLLAGSLHGTLGEARRMRDAGYRAIKVKVGRGPVIETAALVRKLLEELGGEVALRLDANRAWSLEEAEEFARAASGASFEYVEEPLRDPRALPELARVTGLPIALDESLVTMEPDALVEHRYAAAVILKPTLLGGLSAALGFAAEARRIGMRVVVSSAYESGVGTAALVALAAATGEGLPAGLDTYRALAEDVVSPRLGLPAPVVEVDAACGPREILERRLMNVGTVLG